MGVSDLVDGPVELLFFRAGFDGEVEEVELAVLVVLGQARDAEADEADGLLEDDVAEEGLGGRQQILLETRGARKRTLAGEGLEILPADLEAAAGGEASVGAQPPGDVLDELEQDVVEGRAGFLVVEEGVLAGDGFLADVEFDVARILAQLLARKA